MDGCTFVSKLQSLAIPFSEDLKGDDFDWVFLKDSSQPLSQFCQWFVTNIKGEQLLQEEEINHYEDLVANGSVLSSEHLKQIESFLGWDSIEGEGELSLKFQHEEDVSKLEENLQRLKSRKNFISLQRLELEEELRERRETVHLLCKDLEARKRRAHTACGRHSAAVSCGSALVEKNPMGMGPPNTAQWEQEEASFQEGVVTFIDRQFRQGIEHLAGEANSSSSWLLDSRQLADLQLVRGPGQARHRLQKEELSRLNAMLERTEVEAVENALRKAQKDAEVVEAGRFLKMLRATTTPSSLKVLREQTAHLLESIAVLHLETDQVRERASHEAALVAQGERGRVLSSSYEVKLQRQAYFLSKLDQVKEFVLQRCLRLNLARMVLDGECVRVHNLVRALIRLQALVGAQRHAHTARMENLALLEEARLVNSAPEEEVLAHLLVPDAGTGDDVSALQALLVGAEKEEASAAQAQLDALDQLFGSCGRLEQCLFLSRGCPAHTLPRAWLTPGTSARITKVEDAHWQRQQEMLDVLRRLERNKKLMQSDPSVARDLTKWISRGSAISYLAK